MYVQILLSDIIHEKKYKINDGDRICCDFSSSYVNFNFELTGEGAAGPESNVCPTIASAEKAWLALLVSSSVLVKAYAQSEPIKCQTNGSRFGLANVCTDGNKINVDITTNYIPESGKVFEAWLIDDGYKGSGYMLSMGKLLNSGILHFHEVMNNAKTNTDIVIKQASW